MSIIYIQEQGAYLRKQGGRFAVMRRDDVLLSVPESVVERVVIFGNVQISSQVVRECLDRGIEIVYLSMNGKYYGMLEPGYPKNVFMRVKQYHLYSDANYLKSCAAAILSGKLSSEIVTLRRWMRSGWLEETDAVDELQRIRDGLDGKAEISELMGGEAYAAKLYFSALGQALPPEFIWKGRRKHPATDPVNALLSLTYMMCVGEIISKCYAHGLDPFIGYLHQLDYGRPGLALDLIEPLRAMYCDHFVMKMLQKEVFHAKDFTVSQNLGCRLSETAFQEYLKHYQSFHDNGGNLKYSLKGVIEQVVKRQISAVDECREIDFNGLIDREAQNGNTGGI